VPEVISRVQRFELPIQAPREVDLLFVIDNSPAMASYGDRLRANTSGFINVLNTLQGGLPSLHLGVVTTEIAEQGRMRTSDRVAGAFISDVRYESPERFRNYVDLLPEVFAEIADVGSSGDVDARALDAIRLALDQPANAGFLREEALLAVIVITATDDASATSVAAAAQALKSRKADPGRVLISLIAGPCSDELGTASSAPRLHELLDQFPERAIFTSVCQQNLSDALILFASLAYLSVASPCVEAPLLDLEPSIDGVQADCSVVDRFPDETERVIPACDGGDERCWSIEPDELNCPFGPRQRYHITPLSEPFPAGLTIVGECVSA
jgi:hypothetical protein